MQTLVEKFTGVFTALVTPFEENGEIDYSAFEKLVKFQLEAGVAGLVPVGTTGEAATLSEDERCRIIEKTVAVADGQAFVLAGTGSNNTKKAIASTRKAQELGVDGCLVVTPYYNMPTQKGLTLYFSEIAESTELPIVLYNVPGRCGVEIEIDTAAELSETYSNIVGIKEAGGSVERVTALRKACRESFIIHSGDDGLTLPFLVVGAVGVTSVVSNLDPTLMVNLIQAWQNGDPERACHLHERVAELAEVMFIESSPVPVKTAMALQGRMQAVVRSPLASLSSESLTQVTQILDPPPQTG